MMTTGTQHGLVSFSMPQALNTNLVSLDSDMGVKSLCIRIMCNCFRGRWGRVFHLSSYKPLCRGNHGFPVIPIGKVLRSGYWKGTEDIKRTDQGSRNLLGANFSPLGTTVVLWLYSQELTQGRRGQFLMLCSQQTETGSPGVLTGSPDWTFTPEEGFKGCAASKVSCGGHSPEQAARQPSWDNSCFQTHPFQVYHHPFLPQLFFHYSFHVIHRASCKSDKVWGEVWIKDKHETSLWSR